MVSGLKLGIFMHCRLHEIETSVCVDQFLYETYSLDLRPQISEKGQHELNIIGIFFVVFLP